MPLTIKKIQTTRPSDKTITLSDGDGLQLIVAPNGRKGWRFRYTRPDGSKKRNMMSFGSYPTVTLAEAREKANEARRLVSQGIDPTEQRRTEQEALENLDGDHFRTLAHEWHSGKAQQWKATSNRAKLSWSVLENHVFPYVGDRPIQSITPHGLAGDSSQAGTTGQARAKTPRAFLLPGYLPAGRSNGTGRQ